MITVLEYLDSKGHSLFAKWFATLNAPAAAKVTAALIRIEQGNFSNMKGVGAGVCEYRIDFSPGYREKHQSRDILTAGNCWQDFKARKVKET